MREVDHEGAQADVGHRDQGGHADQVEHWDLLVGRDDHSRVEVREAEPLEPDDGEAVLRVERVGVTANNVTYAVLGDALRYWQFFPAPEQARADGWGRVPLWGFAEVVASRAEGVAVGERVYGYLPTSSHLRVRPESVRPPGDGFGRFRDASPHRADLPSVYNAYSDATDDDVDLQVLFRPLFTTSWMLADWLDDAGPDAEAVVLSSASSKTAYGTAFLLRDVDVEVVGLTSAGNVGFTEGLGLYDRVLSYDDVRALEQGRATAYVDVAGSTPLRREIHEHLREQVVRDVVVGIAQGTPGGDPGEIAGARPSMFFAPDQIARRRQDWGPEVYERRYAEAWESFVGQAAGWVDVEHSSGPAALRDTWTAVLGGVGPRVGHVVLP